jgi:hypothetical protein
MPGLRLPGLTSPAAHSWSGQALEILAMRGAVSGRRCIFGVATQSPSSRSALMGRACRRSNPNGLRSCGQSAVHLVGWWAQEFPGRKEMRIVDLPRPTALPRGRRNSLATTTYIAAILTLGGGHHLPQSANPGCAKLELGISQQPFSVSYSNRSSHSGTPPCTAHYKGLFFLRLPKCIWHTVCT